MAQHVKCVRILQSHVLSIDRIEGLKDLQHMLAWAIIGGAGCGTCCLPESQFDFEVGINKRTAKISINVPGRTSKHIKTLKKAL